MFRSMLDKAARATSGGNAESSSSPRGAAPGNTYTIRPTASRYVPYKPKPSAPAIPHSRPTRPIAAPIAYSCSSIAKNSPLHAMLDKAARSQLNAAPVTVVTPLVADTAPPRPPVSPAAPTPVTAPPAALVVAPPPAPRAPSLAPPSFYASDMAMRALAVRASALASLKSKKWRRPSAGNERTYSPYRPDVPASQRILAWVTPFTFIQQASMDTLRLELQAKLLTTLIGRYEERTLASYGAGCLRFTQWCDREGISESLRMPADPILLAGFVADMHEGGTGGRVRNWMSGLQMWHRINGAVWTGDDYFVNTALKTADKEGAAFKRPPRNAVSVEHLRALKSVLVLSRPRDAALWAAALVAFWGCRRLGELLPCANRKFDPKRHPTRSTDLVRGDAEGHTTISFHIPYTKTTGEEGARCRVLSTPPQYNDLCPIWALDNHLAINCNLPDDVHLFAFANGGSATSLFKEMLQPIMDEIVVMAGLDPIKGHSYRIGGTLRLLLDGVPPEHIMQTGGWTSLCFLTYWRRLDVLVPTSIARAWRALQDSFATAHRINLPTV